MKPDIQVVAGIIYDNEFLEILITRKKIGLSMEGLWEFPGGKVEVGEDFEIALKREINEELNIEIEVVQLYHNSIFNSTENIIHLTSYLCRYCDGEIKLTDHDDFQWVKKNELSNFNFSPADIPIAEKLSADI